MASRYDAPRAVDDRSPPRIELENPVHNFGKVGSGKVLETSFEVRNLGGQRLILRQLNGGCDCLVPQRAEIVVDAGAARTIAAQFDAGNSQGPRRVELRYRTNDPSAPTVSFVVLADVQPVRTQSGANPAAADPTKSVRQAGPQ